MDEVIVVAAVVGTTFALVAGGEALGNRGHSAGEHMRQVGFLILIVGIMALYCGRSDSRGSCKYGSGPTCVE